MPPVRLLGLERVERANVWLTARFFPGADGDYGRVERLREAGPRMTTDEFAKVVRSMARPRNPPLDLSSVSAPTLVLYGENELPFVKLHAARFAAHVPAAGVEEVPDAGHASNLDNPEYVTDAMRAVLTARTSDFDRPTPRRGSRRRRRSRPRKNVLKSIL